jgi:radical SAM protein with 4Fe4S-binding SPASM domain
MELLKTKGCFNSATEPILPSIGGCLVNRPFAFGVSPKGSITKCWTDITNETKAVGTIDDMALAEKGTPLFLGCWEDKECLECPVLATCGGGCYDRHANSETRCGQGGSYCRTDHHYDGCNRCRWTIDQQIISLYSSLQN